MTTRLEALFLAALLTCVTAPATAGDTAAAGGGSGPTSGLAGRQAVQFSVGDDFTLSAFQGQLFSYQRFLTDRRAFRLAVGLTVDRSEGELEVEYGDGEPAGALDLDGWNNKATLKAQMLFYYGGGPLYLFWGGGPKLTYTNFRGEVAAATTFGDEVGFIVFARSVDGWGAGLQGFAGIEWFMNEHFSLHAEYAVSGMYIYEREADERLITTSTGSYEKVVSETWSPRFTSDGVRFGLSAYY